LASTRHLWRPDPTAPAPADDARNAQSMHTFLTFGDIEGKLDMLTVERTRCPRKGRYSVAKLIAEHGRQGNMMKWKEGLSVDCPRRDAHALHERCDLVCWDLPKVL
jgi:hypothetical protein